MVVHDVPGIPVQGLIIVQENLVAVQLISVSSYENVPFVSNASQIANLATGGDYYLNQTIFKCEVSIGSVC